MPRSLLHQGVRHCLFTIQTTRSGPAVVRVPTAASQVLDGPMQFDQIGARYNLLAASGYCVPALRVLTAEQEPPYGGLITEFRKGRAVNLPMDLRACAEALFHLHSERKDPAARMYDIVAVIQKHMACLAHAPIANKSKQLITKIKRDALGIKIRFQGDSPLMIDAHPGNFIVVQEEGKERVMAVDIENSFKGNPVLDLAHLTLFASLLWQDKQASPLAAQDILDFYKHYAALSAQLDERVVHSLSPQLCLAARRQVLARSLGWMLCLVTNAHQANIDVPRKDLAAAYNILQADTLRLGLEHEEQLARLWQQ